MTATKAGTRPMRERILVVDDEHNARVALRTILSEEGYEIAEAADGEEALALLPGFAPAAILADVRMPRMDGIELVSRIRQELGDMSVPVILISTLGSDQDVRRGLEAGATAYLVKPLSPYRIKRLIEQLLAAR